MVKKIMLFFVISMVLCSQSVVYADDKKPEQVKKPEYEKVILMKEHIVGDTFVQVYKDEKGKIVQNSIVIPVDVRIIVNAAENRELEAKKQMMLVASKYNLNLKIKELKHQYAFEFDAKTFAIDSAIEEKMEREEYEMLFYTEREMEKWNQIEQKEREKEIEKARKSYGFYYDYDEDTTVVIEGPKINDIPYSIYKKFSDEELKEYGIEEGLKAYGIKGGIKELKKKNGEVKKATEKKETTKIEDETSFSWGWVIAFTGVVLLLGVAFFIRKKRG